MIFSHVWTLSCVETVLKILSLLPGLLLNMQATKALASMRSAGSALPSLVISAISTKLSCTGLN